MTQSDILIVAFFFSLIRRKLIFRKAIGAAGFLLWENPGYLGCVQVSY